VADLQRLGDDDLWAIGKEALPAAHWRRHLHLLCKGERAALSTSGGRS
jgi:hypothetical protein